MIIRLSKNIASFFSQKNIIPAEELDSYIYGFQLMLSMILNMSIISVIMLYSGKFIETILYLASVLTLRHHTGGYHAKTPERCFIMTVVIYVLILLITSIITKGVPIIIYSLLLISLVVIIRIAPIKHENNPVSDSDLQRHRRYSIVMSVIIACIIIVFTLLEQYALSLTLSLGIFQVSTSLLVEKIKKGGVMS